MHRQRIFTTIIIGSIIATTVWVWYKWRIGAFKHPHYEPPYLPPTPQPQPPGWRLQPPPPNEAELRATTTESSVTDQSKTAIRSGRNAGRRNNNIQPAAKPQSEPTPPKDKDIESFAEADEGVPEQPEEELLARVIGQDTIYWEPYTPSPPSPTASEASETPTAKPTAESEYTYPLNINTADLDALTTLPGVGSVLAQRIIDHREANGPFKTIEELIDIQGIGPNNFAAFAHLITI